MKKQNLILSLFVCMFAILVVYSCTKEQDPATNDSHFEDLINTFEYESSTFKDVLTAEDPVRVKDYCVGKITKVDSVAKGYEDKYKVGATICNLCDEDQVDCKDMYWTRVWKDGKFLALIKVDNDPEHCTACPDDGIKIE